jgi:membrane protease YdiL (CAAX protease family)
MSRIAKQLDRLPRSESALIEVLVMCLPAIPAYLWLWPNVHGTMEWVTQFVVYGYIPVGTLYIGLRRWSLNELGINRKGIGLSLVSGLVLLTGRLLVILSVEWGAGQPQYSFINLTGQVLFYVGVVGLVEELLFRGLIFRALEEWRGMRWAIWGSSFGFLLWHVFGQGILIGVTTFFIGIIFALIRWRAGGILGLIFIHGLWDLQALLLIAESNAASLARGRPEISFPALMWTGLALMLLVPVFLWKLGTLKQFNPPG